jgi:hypothetical protein
MPVAIWGDEAQNFSSQLECILILHAVKVAYFNGASLSIYRQSRLIEYNHVFNNHSAQTLKQWYDSFVAERNNTPPAATSPQPPLVAEKTNEKQCAMDV